MSADKSRRRSVWAPFIFSVVLVAGILIGFFLHRLVNNKRPISAIINQNDPLEEIIELISDRYVDSVSTDSLYADAVNGILKHLDPHTSYIPARELDAVNEDLEGKFQGIGVEFFIIKDTIQITSVISGGPSEKAGIQAGDKLIKVNDSLVAGIAITNEQIIARLRGSEDSEVRLTLLRQGQPRPITLSVKRGTIPLYSVDAAYMMPDKRTGYMRINRFSAATHEEFKKALAGLEQEGMQQLILDLRQNPGGYLEAASYIADEFLDDEKIVVYTEGRRSPKEEYKAQRPGAFEKGRLVILVDEGSASASEILAGAIQDWDRGIVIGRRTFGKGLVQEQYDLSDGSALRLTIARYYTPTGRSIQRPYTKGREAYELDYISRFTDGSLMAADTGTPADTARFYTKVNHRTIFGGGGIRPDVITPYDASYYSAALAELLNGNDIFTTFVYEYYAKHSEQIKSLKTFDQFDNSFDITPDMMEDLRKKFQLENAFHARAVWQNPNDLDYLRTRMKALIARMQFSNNGFYQVLNKTDLTIKRAMSVLNGLEYEEIINGKAPAGTKQETKSKKQ